MQARLRDEVRRRAGNRCEYCHLRQEYEPFYTFHVEHIVARQHAGGDDLENLALACHHCNLHKGPNLAGRDPDTGELVRLFHPRQDTWTEHFVREGCHVIGLSPIGRTSAWVLQMNSAERVQLRRMLQDLGELD